MSKSRTHAPPYMFDTLKGLGLPCNCSLIGVESTDDAVELPGFTHPQQAAYNPGAGAEQSVAGSYGAV